MRRISGLAAMVLLAATAAGAETVTLHVAPGGKDAWSGRAARPADDGSDGPLASMEGARDAIRTLRKKGKLPGPVRVVFAAGRYELDRPVLFTPADSGSAECPITYEAAEGARVVLDAGRPITGLRQTADGLWEARLPAVAKGDWRFEELYVNGRRAVRAREPDEFWFYADHRAGEAVDPLTGKKADLSKRAFYAKPEQLADIAGFSRDQLADVTMVAYHSWSVGVHRLAKADAKTGLLVTTGGVSWPFFKWKNIQRFHLENYAAALDAPGEWFCSRDGVLRYKPLPGEALADAAVYAPRAKGFVTIAGEPHKGRLVEHLTFRGLAFLHAAHILPKDGRSNFQAAVGTPSAVTANGARHVAFEGCELGFMGGYGVYFHNGCRHCRLTKCYIHDLGAGGVRIGDTTWNKFPAEADRTGHVTVDNCIIRSGGHLFRGAVGVLIAHAADNALTHCDVSDFRYTAVSVGWLWRYGDSPAKRNVVEHNRLHHLGYGILSDMGGVYTLGESPGTRVCHNLVHHVHSFDYGGWGLYTDQASTGILFEKNLVHDVKTGTFHQHFGKENVVRNNILAYSLDPQLKRSKKEDHVSFIFERNIVYWKEGDLLGGRWKDDNVVMRSNLYWKEGGKEFDFAGMSFKEWKASGKGEGSIIADPLFVAPGERDFRLEPGSPAKKIGFEPFDAREAGVRKDDPAWVKLAETYEYPELRITPKPILTFHQDYERFPVGRLPGGPMYFPGRKGSIGVTDAIEAAGGKRCLKVADSPDIRPRYNPHFFFDPGHVDGVTTFAFDIRIDEKTELFHAWRDGARDYKVGPRLRIAGGELLADKKKLLDLPAGRWVRVAVRSGIGSASTGTYDVTVTLAGAKPRAFPALPNVSGELKALHWLGFASLAETDATWYLDNVELTFEKR